MPPRFLPIRSNVPKKKAKKIKKRRKYDRPPLDKE